MRSNPRCGAFGRQATGRALSLLSALSTLACASAVHVAVDERPDLSACRHWAWLPSTLEVTPDVDPLVRGAIARELGERGFEPAEGGVEPCLLVGYRLALRRELVTRNEGAAQQRVETFGTGGGAMGGSPGPIEIGASQSRLVAYEAGTLQLDVAQGGEGRLVWQARWEGRARTGLAEQLDDAVAELFERFPAGPAPGR